MTPIVTTENYWHGGDSNDAITGFIRMTSPDLPSALSSVTTSLSNLNSKGGGYHVHSLPVNKRSPGNNICDTTSGHYNPLGMYYIFI